MYPVGTDAVGVVPRGGADPALEEPAVGPPVALRLFEGATTGAAEFSFSFS